MSTVRWSDIRDTHVETTSREAVERGTSRLISQVPAHRLANMHKRRGLTQRQVAQVMGVTVGRVSQIENGELSGIDVPDVTTPPSEASAKSSPTSATNSSRPAERRR